MTDTCAECGRAFAKDKQEWFDSHAPGDYPEGPLCGMAVDLGPSQCRIYSIRRLKAHEKQLMDELENFDTTEAQNHAVRVTVDALTRILDERRQVGRFGSEQLQGLADRILKLAISDWERN